MNYLGSVQLTKEDQDGKGLAGAVFKITDTNGETVRDDLVSKEDGKMKLTG
ncbi:SpaA isopeptide-forming pilin-related protein [Bacillus spizizenii]